MKMSVHLMAWLSIVLYVLVASSVSHKSMNCIPALKVGVLCSVCDNWKIYLVHHIKCETGNAQIDRASVIGNLLP